MPSPASTFPINPRLHPRQSPMGSGSHQAYTEQQMYEIPTVPYYDYTEEQLRTKIGYYNERIAILQRQIEDQEWMRDEILGIIALRSTAL